jgi:homoserine dehydrogenase
MQEPKHVRLIVSGLGNIGARFIAILNAKQAHLRTKYGLVLQVVGAADSRGTVADAAGLDLSTIVQLKEQGQSVAAYPALGRPGHTALELVEQLDAEVLCEATPVNLEHGEPGLSCIRAALGRCMHVVTANKGPLVLAYDELLAKASEQGVELRFCGTVAGGLPAINLGQRDLAGATIERVEALPNLTTSFILGQMTQGQSYEQALAAAQAQGCAEADPTLDVEGWDAAVKLVILANSVLGFSATLDEVSVQGITALTQADLEQANAKDQVIKLVASAVREAEDYRLSVAPTALPRTHPLAKLSGQQMGVVYYTDIYGVIEAAITETEPTPSAATLLRDILGILA